MTRPMPPSLTPPCRILAPAPHRPISVHPGVYPSAIGIGQSKHPRAPQPDLAEPAPNIE